MSSPIKSGVHASALSEVVDTKRSRTVRMRIAGRVSWTLSSACRAVGSRRTRIQPSPTHCGLAVRQDSLQSPGCGMNLPNKLTISRFALTIAFLVVMFSEMQFRETIALILFIAGGATDFLDGHLARRHKLITNFGILMDPLADKILVCSAFIAFVGLAWVQAWMAVVVVARELAITGL